MSDVDMLRRLNAQEQRLGQIYDQIACTYVPLQTALAEISGALAGAALNIGTYTVGPVGSGATYTFNYPSSARAIMVRLSCRWAASGSAVGYVIPSGASTNETGAICRALVAGLNSDSVGNVTLSTAGIAQLIISTTNTAGCSLYVIGYFI
jgi:hypothetical protein